MGLRKATFGGDSDRSGAPGDDLELVKAGEDQLDLGGEAGSDAEGQARAGLGKPHAAGEHAAADTKTLQGAYSLSARALAERRLGKRLCSAGPGPAGFRDLADVGLQPQLLRLRRCEAQVHLGRASAPLAAVAASSAHPIGQWALLLRLPFPTG